MRRFPTALVILLFSAFMAYTGYRIYWHEETSRIDAVAKVRDQRSEIYAHLLIRYENPPVYEEEYKMQDVEGVSTFQYRIRTYSGTQVTVKAPPAAVHDVSYFYGKLDQDGVWQIVNQPDRGDTNTRYEVYVKQLADFKQGDRTVTFTDPHYWATTAGRQFNINLSKTNPNDVLKMKSTVLADNRYQTVVNDFRAFGPDSFRAKIAALRKKFGLPAVQ
jgi:hypothetical protein